MTLWYELTLIIQKSRSGYETRPASSKLMVNNFRDGELDWIDLLGWEIEEFDDIVSLSRKCSEFFKRE